MLTESQAWREVALRVERVGLGMSGLCSVASEIKVAGGITYETYRNMVHRAMDHVNDYVGGGVMYAFPPGTHREERILAAYWLALVAEEEGK